MVNGRTVLLVTPNVDGGSRAALADAGYDVTIPPTGSLTASEIDEEVACLVTGAALPDRDGLAFVSTVRNAHPALPIVVHADAGSEPVASRAFTAGADEYVPGTEAADELVNAVDRVLERARQRRLRYRRTGSSELSTDDSGNDGRRDLERYRTIVETVDDMIYALDEEGRITLANAAFAYYFDRPREDLVGADVAAVLPREAYERGEELVRALWKADGTNHGRYEFTIERPSGEPMHLENHLALLFDDDETFDGAVGVVRDVTRRREQAAALERQNERLDEFASIVSHDLRNPLNVIQGTIARLRETGDPSHLEELEACAERMDALLSDLLTLAREGQAVADVEAVSLERVAVDAWRAVDTADATLDLGADLGTIDADRSRLRQLLENLIRNAVEHNARRASDRPVPGDGVEHGSTGGQDGSRPDDGVEQGGSAVTVTVARLEDGVTGGFAVADDGLGVDDPERVFERGYTTHQGGTGFGLSIVQRIVEAHGWSIALEDSSEGGARFVIRT